MSDEEHTSYWGSNLKKGDAYNLHTFNSTYRAALPTRNKIDKQGLPETSESEDRRNP